MSEYEPHNGRVVSVKYKTQPGSYLRMDGCGSWPVVCGRAGPIILECSPELATFCRKGENDKIVFCGAGAFRPPKTLGVDQ